MEHIPPLYEHRPSFEERFGKYLTSGRTEIETADIDAKEKVAAYKRADQLEKNLPRALSDESKTYLASLSEADFTSILIGILHHFEGNINRSLENITPLSTDNLKNILMYRTVYGYGHPDIKKREEEHPTPSAQEVLLGCYVEQLETQTREAVLILRSKGYQTVESGFHNQLSGSQFFHLEETVPTTVSDELIADIYKKFDVAVDYDNHNRGNGRIITYIQFIPRSFKDLAQWKECLDYFAEHMPVVGEESFSTVGGAVLFWEQIKQRFTLESVLATARTPREQYLIRKLYACKNKKEVATLVKSSL